MQLLPHSQDDERYDHWKQTDMTIYFSITNIKILHSNVVEEGAKEWWWKAFKENQENGIR